jgi:hypothetical protein
MRTVWTLLLASTIAFADTPKLVLDEAKLAPPSEVAEPIRKLLGDDGVRVKDASGRTIADVWFRREFSSTANETQVKNGLTLRELIETTVIGVVRFEQAFTDFRKQEIPAGAYSLRLGFQPETGDHKDTAPHTEFAMLVPVAKDLSAETMEPKELFKLSLSATGGDHAGVLLLYPNREKGGAKLVDRGHDIWTLDTQRPCVADGGKGDLGLGITVNGYSRLR